MIRDIQDLLTEFIISDHLILLISLMDEDMTDLQFWKVDDYIHLCIFKNNKPIVTFDSANIYKIVNFLSVRIEDQDTVATFIDEGDLL